MFSSIHFLAGYWVGQETSTSYKNYTTLTDLLIFVVLSATAYQLINRFCLDFSLQKGNETLPVSLTVCIAFSLALYYSLCFRMQYGKISKTFSLIETTRLSLSEVDVKGHFNESASHDLKRNTIHVYFGIFASFTSSLLFSVQPLLRSSGVFGMDKKKQLQIDIWCPFDFQLPFVFEAVVIILFLVLFSVGLKCFANDVFYMSVMKINIRFLKHLEMLGKEILSLNINQNSLPSDKNKSFSKRKRLNLKLLQPIQGDIKNITEDLFCDDVFLLTFNEEFNKRAEEKMAKYIQNHQLILRCCEQACQLYGPVMLMYVLSMMGFASVGAFGVLHTNGFGVAQSMAFVFFSAVNLLNLYLMCEAGDDLSDQSGRVATAIVGDPWYVCSRQFRTSLVLVLQRVNTRVQACVIGLPTMPLCCATFVWFSKTLISFYLFLVNVQDMMKN